jgi:TonB family protein
MSGFGWKAWSAAFVLSTVVHLGITAGLRAPTSGAAQKPAGAPTTVSGSLASILGGIQSTEAVKEADTPDDVPIERVPAIRPRSERAAVAQSIQQPVVARTASAAPIVPTTEVAPVEEARTIEPQASQPAKATPATQPERQSAETVKRHRPATKHKQEDKPKRQPKVRKKRSPRKQRRRRQAKSNAGSNQQGAASSSSGGRRGRMRASQGSVLNYGSRVRTRILSNRPNATGHGVAVVSFGVSGSGGLRFARLARSSGNSTLDRAAVSAVRRSAPFPRPPAGASSRQLRFSISFSFR